MIHHISQLVIQLGIIIFAAQMGARLFRKLRLPPVLGELTAGIIIGPSLLGAVTLPGFPEGIFPVLQGTFPVSTELYGIAVIGSIILLFNAGLETDISMLMRFSLSGLVIGLGGVLVSLAGGMLVTSLVLDLPLMDPKCLMMGVISTATSVGITTRILCEMKKTSTPEGVTVLAAAVIDDIIGIILLAVVIGISTVQASGGSMLWGKVGLISVKAIAVWLGFSILGLLIARQLAALLKTFKVMNILVILSLGLGFLIAGIFEMAGLAMIIGSFVTGLIFSTTDLRHVLESRLSTLYAFFVPVFFTVTGMFVDFRVFLDSEVLFFGGLFTAVAIGTKIIGCGIPSLFMNFTPAGAMRIGFGMAPRSEVALIIAGTGLSYHILGEKSMGAVVMMVMFSVLIAPPVLQRLLRSKRSGTKKTVKTQTKEQIDFDFPSASIADLITYKVIDYFRTEGFFIQSVHGDVRIYHIAKDEIFITFMRHPSRFVFELAHEDKVLVKTVVYEALLEVHDSMAKLKTMAKPGQMRRELTGEGGRKTSQKIVAKALKPSCVSLKLNAGDKDAVIHEMVDLLYEGGAITDREDVLAAVQEREKRMSTGMPHGIALPHAKTDSVDSIVAAVGISKEGLDFESIDGKPSRIFIMVISPAKTSGPHIQFLAEVSTLLNSKEKRAELLSLRDPGGVVDFFTGS